MCCCNMQLCDGASPAERASWQLGAPEEYHYLNQSSCTQLKGVDNAEEYKVQCNALCPATPPPDNAGLLLHIMGISWYTGCCAACV